MSVAIEEPPERVIQFKITTKIMAVNRVIAELSRNNTVGGQERVEMKAYLKKTEGKSITYCNSH